MPFKTLAVQSSQTPAGTAGAHTVPDRDHLAAGGGAAGAAADAGPGGVAGDAHLLDPDRGAAVPWCAQLSAQAR